MGGIFPGGNFPGGLFPSTPSLYCSLSRRIFYYLSETERLTLQTFL